MNVLTRLLAALALCAAAAPAARADVEEGAADPAPWSAACRTQKDETVLQALDRYDRITRRKAGAWHRQHRASRMAASGARPVAGWASASVMEAEPRRPGPNGAPPAGALSIAEQKTLLACAHDADLHHAYPGAMTPDGLWRLLRLHLKANQTPLIIDLEPGGEVWSYPVYAYRIEYARQGDSDDYTARLTLWLADDEVPADFVGLQPRRQDYRFAFRMSEGAVVAGSGRWLGLSREDHPGLAWCPIAARPANPHLDIAEVRALVQAGRPAAPAKKDERARPVPPRADGPVTLSPAELVALVLDRTSSFKLDVTVDRFDGGQYQLGETYSVTGSSAKAGYLHLLHVAPDGKLTLLYPLHGQDNHVRANRPIHLPGPADRFAYRACAPYGNHRVKAVVTSRPLAFTGLAAAPADGGGRGFRWHPTQQRLLADLLKAGPGKRAPDGLGKPADVVGAFAQDEVLFYVGPAEKK
jgi:hypothetical protein